MKAGSSICRSPSMRMRSVSPSAAQAKRGLASRPAPSAPAALRKLRRSVFHLIMSFSPAVGGGALEGLLFLPARLERVMAVHHAVRRHPARLGGASLRQRSRAIGQRVWNSQPEGRRNTLGISPRMARSARRRRGSGTGSEAISVAV